MGKRACDEDERVFTHAHYGWKKRLDHHLALSYPMIEVRLCPAIDERVPVYQHAGIGIRRDRWLYHSRRPSMQSKEVSENWRWSLWQPDGWNDGYALLMQCLQVVFVSIPVQRFNWIE